MQTYTKKQITKEEILPLARRMRSEGRMLVMIHGYVDANGANVISYDYEVPGGVEAYELTQTEKVLPSISEVYDAAAAWPEKELEELMGMQFEGLNMPERLFLPEDMLDERGHILVTPLSELREQTLKREDERQQQG